MPAACPAAGERGHRRDGAEPSGLEIAPGEDGEHAGQGERGRDIHAADGRVGDRGAHEDGVGLAGQVHVVGEAAASGEERSILAAPPA